MGDSLDTMSAADAIGEFEASVRRDGVEADVAYFTEHRRRFEHSLLRIPELAKSGGRVLDVGSHYLHIASTLRLMGYDVVAIDVPEFASLDLVRNRAAGYGVENHAVERLDAGEFLSGVSEEFDVIVFTEILEHITFNPVSFWRRIYELMKLGGSIYLTTPNALTPWKMLHVLKRLVMQNGIGLTAPEIFHTVSFGHHWKEYSASEIRDYFSRLTPDFAIVIVHFNYPASAVTPRVSTFKDLARSAVHTAAAAVPSFRDQIEAVIRLEARTHWLIQPPNFL